MARARAESNISLDGIAETYDPTSPSNDFDYFLLHYDFETSQKFIIGNKVIELGCGRGVLTEKLIDVCKQLIVVEGSKRNIEHAKKKIPKEAPVTFHNSLWQNFSYSDSDISDVVFFSGLEHIDKRTGLKVLTKIKIWLRDDGRLHIVVPNANSLHRRIAYHMRLIKDVHDFSERDVMLGHKIVYDRERLFELLNIARFQIIHWEGILLKPFTNSMMMNYASNVIEGLYQAGKELPDYCAHLYVVCKKEN